MLRFVFNFIQSAVLFSLAAILIVSLYILPNLPDIETLKDIKMQVPLRVYSADLSLIAEYGEKRRKPIKIDDLPPMLVNAFLAAEDDRFYEHPGVDWQGLVRATYSLIKTGTRKQGGSTITMQVARNFFLSREKTYLRKLNEIFLAFKIERELSKKEILELYLNKIFLGQRAYGVAAASQVYYGTDINSLNLSQLAMIAGLPKAPSKSNPVTNPERALQRRSYVLQRMLELSYITNDEFNQANETKINATLHRMKPEIEARYLAEMVRNDLFQKYGKDAYTDGLEVTTTIRDTNQIAANNALINSLLAYDRRHGYRGPEQHIDDVDSKNDEPILVVKKYVNEYQIQIIVVGYPIGLNNSENRMTNLVDQFINELDTLNLEVHKIDERLSSKLFENNKSDRIDDLSALEILESYLSQNE